MCDTGRCFGLSLTRRLRGTSDSGEAGIGAGRLSVVEQLLDAVRAVLAGAEVTELASDLLRLTPGSRALRRIESNASGVLELPITSLRRSQVACGSGGYH